MDSVDIKAGDVVYLKSGGPAMTVTSVGSHNGTPSAWCVWFDKLKQHNGTFALVAVTKEDPYAAAYGIG